MIQSLSDIHLFCDIDGTLGIAGIGIPERNRQAIARFVEEGGHFALCTGRGITNIKPFVEGLPINGDSVIGNGCAIYSFQEDRARSVTYIPPEGEAILKEILVQHREFGVLLINEEGYFILQEEGRPDHGFSREFPRCRLEELHGPYYKFLFTVPQEEAQRIFEELQNREHPGVDFVRSALTSIEMLPHGVSKASAFLRLCQEKEIPVENTVFIGDFYNDREMFCTAGLPACVQGTPEDLKPLCKLVLGPCMEGAVADLIQWLEERYPPRRESAAD